MFYLATVSRRHNIPHPLNVGDGTIVHPVAPISGTMAINSISGAIMAILSPSTLPSVRHDSGLYRELDVIERLTLSLPDDYEIFHGVPLHTIHEARDRYGEMDIVVLGPEGNILILEIKTGSLLLQEGGIFKVYGGQAHDIGRQCTLQRAAMVNRLKAANIVTAVSHCLVMPDFTLHDQQVVSLPRERIIDAGDFPQLGTRVRQCLDVGIGCTTLPALRHFLRNEFQVSPDLATLRHVLQRTTRQIADGLATWVPRIHAAAGILRIQATAGSGKTQLALQLMQDAVAQAQSVAYVCYNRALADHVRTIAPPRADVSNFHDLGVAHFRRHHGEPDFEDPTVFEHVTATYLNDSETVTPRLDMLIIDEGQDFAPEWIESLCGQLKPDGRLYFMEDADQRLYERAAFEFADAVTLRCEENYRTPRAICQVINALGLASVPIQPKSPFVGQIPVFYRYDSERTLLRQTAAAVSALLAQGFALADIVVLSGRGRSKSVLLAQDKIGAHTTRRFTGDYDRQGEPRWSDGDLLVESVYRYKGQSAPAVVLSEVDFTALTALERRKLFVGMTRAQMALAIVLSASAERACAECIGAA